MSTVKDLLEGNIKGVVPLRKRSDDDQRAAFERHASGTSAESEGEDEGDEIEAQGSLDADDGESEAPELNEFGMTAEQMEALPPAARARLTGETKQPETAGRDEARDGSDDTDLADIEADLVEEFGKKSAKKLMDRIVRPMRETQRASINGRVERVQEQFSRAYPEIKNPDALNAAVSIAARQRKPGDTDAVAFRRALVTLWGDRKAQARSQLEGQLSSPVKAGDKRPPISKDEATEAYFNTVTRTGSRGKAQRAFRELNGRSR